MHGDARWALGDEARTIADGLARGNIAERNDSRAKRKAWAESHLRHHFRFLFWRCESLVIAVEDRTGTHDVAPGAWPSANRAAIGKVDHAG